MNEDLVSVLELYTKHCVRQWLDDGAFQHDRIFLQFWQVVLLKTMATRLGTLARRSLTDRLSLAVPVKPGRMDGVRARTAERGEGRS